MATSEADVAAKLIERLLMDPAFRARFRRDPAGACREVGLDGVAQEMSVGGGKAMYTLDMRESKSSLAGVMMAAAMEGVGIYQFTENVLPHLEEVPRHVADVLSRVDLPAIGGVLHKPPALASAAVPAPSGDGLGDAADPAGNGVDASGAAPAAAAAPAAPAVPAETPAAAAAAAAPPDAAAKAADKAAAVPAGGKAAPAAGDAAQKAAKRIAEANSPGAAQQAQVDGAAKALDAQGSDLPDPASLPTGSDAPAAGVAGATAPAGVAGTAAPAGAAAPPETPAPAAPAAPLAPAAPPDAPAPAPGAPPVEPAAPVPDASLPTESSSGASATDAAAPGRGGGQAAAAVESAQPRRRSAIDPTQFGGDGHGGSADPEALALLRNKNVILDADGINDIKAGRIDPRVVAVLTKLSGEHKVTVSCDHHLGRGADITAIDGETVGPGSALAREVASELSTLDPTMRPNEIGSPWAISGPGYFTDAAHQDHLHLGFKDPITPDWTPPADVAAADAPPAPAAVADAPAAAPVQPPAAPAPAAPAAVAAAPAPAPVAAAAPPAPVPKGSQGFLRAVTAQDAAKHRAGDSQAFLKAVEPPKPVASAAAPATFADVAAAAAAAAPDAYPGDSAPQAEIAAWMAGQAAKRGLPPELPLMASLVESGMKNLNFGDADSVGFFQMRVGTWNQGAYAGFADKPELQVKWFLDNAETVKRQRMASGRSVTDPKQFGDWIADVERPAEQYRGRYQLKLDQAQGLLKQAAPVAPAHAAAAAAAAPVAPGQAVADAAAVGTPNGGGSSMGAAALRVAQSQRGVREIGGANRGPQVDQYLAAAKVGPGNPWCASFVTWSLEQAGHKMPGGGWAAVSTWVRNAEQGANGVKLVSAEDARPGDIVAYDWGGQNDFGSDGHIGFLASNVKGGQFSALEGNNGDAVNLVPRHVGGGPNVVFLRVEGNAPPGAAAGGAPPVEPGAPSAAAAAVETAQPRRPSAIDPAQFGGDGHGGSADPEALALLRNKNVILDADGVNDIKAGRIDPRVVAVLTKLSGEHKVTVSCMCSDHDKFTAGGSVSNHHLGRGADIAAIDGETVGPGSALAREVASELSTLDPTMRPNEIGSPWAISGPGYFTDAAHQNHLHIGFKDPIPTTWTPPADVAAPAAAAPAAVADVAAVGSAPAAVAGVPAAAAPGVPAAPPVPPPAGSQSFLKAVTAQDAAAHRAKQGDSQAFLKAVEPPPPVAAAAVAPGAPAPVADVAAAQSGAPAPVAEAADAAGAALTGVPDAYPGDNAPREQIAAWMGAQAEKRGLPKQLPVMASLVESGMKNLNFGDADSVGYYQMRVGIWNQGDYAGYPDKPELQVKWFLDQAEAVKRQREAAGKSVTDPNQFGDWIADVERPAEQYRGRYQLKLDEANGLFKSAQPAPAAAPAVAAAVAPADAAPASADPADAVPAPAAAAAVDPAAAAAAAAGLKGLPAEIAGPVGDAIAAGNGPGPKALAAIEEASKHIGEQYQWGGSTPQTGFDCSGLMQWAYAQSGIQIPRVTYTQIAAANGIDVDRSHLKPGDLVFFSSAGDVHHVGMFLGGDKFLHAPHTGDVVKVSSLDEPYYQQQFAGGRRFDQAAAAASAPAPAVAPAAAPASFAAAGAPAVDATEVAKAQAAVARDAAEVRRNDSQLFRAITAEESRKNQHASVMFLKAVDPSQVRRANPVAAAAAAPPAPAPVPQAPAAPVPAAAAAAPEAAAPSPELSAGASVDLAAAATDYPGDTAGQAELAKWLAGQAQKAGLPPELPVMASLVESGVKNLNFGDADSVGFFQMRVGVWNQGDYAGYPDKPELQAKWFIDQALEVKRKAIASGDANFGKDPATFGEWIANVERPAEQFRGRYQLRLGEARKLLS